MQAMSEQFGGNAYHQWLRSQGPQGFHHPARVEDELRRFTWLPFHRLARASAHFRWWWPLVGAVVFLVVFFVLQVLGQVLVMLGVGGRADFDVLMARILSNDDPKVMVILTFVSLAVGIPAAWAAAVCSRQKWGNLWSVAGQLRWDVFGMALRSAAPVYGWWMVFMLGSTWKSEGTEAFGFSLDAAVYLLLVVGLIPFQCVAEELVFRGWLPQVLGAWITNPVVCYVLPTVGFALLHDYQWISLVDVFIFGLLAAYMTHRTGGIEAAMAIHILNNVMLFSVMGFLADSSVQEALSDAGQDPGETDYLVDFLAMLISVVLTTVAVKQILGNAKLRAACGNAQLLLR